MPSVPAHPRVRVLWWSGFGLLMLLAGWLRLTHLDWADDHFDERIAVGVSRHLERTPGWDNNWRRADIPPFSSADQYNFSAYLYATHLFRRASQSLTADEWLRRRDGLLAHRLFAGLCGLAAVAVGALAARRWGGTAPGLAAGALLAVNPQLVQEAHYARPETFMTLLFAGVLWLGASDRWGSGRLVIMAALIGVMTATKVNSFVLVLVLLAGLAMEVVSRSDAIGRAAAVGASMRRSAAVGAAFLAGWALGVPAALGHWAAYLSGVNLLRAQYSGDLRPFSLPDHREVWPMMFDYYRATWGGPLLALLVGGLIVVGWRRQWRTLLLLGLPVAGAVALFGAQKIFFERNLSTVVPAGLILAAFGAVGLAEKLVVGRWARGIVVSLSILAVALPSGRADWRLMRVALSGADGWGLLAYLDGLKHDFPKAARVITSLKDESDLEKIRRELVTGDGEVLLTVTDFNDAHTARLLGLIQPVYHAQELTEYRGAFWDYPTCTLNTTHGSRWRTYLLRLR